MNKEITINGVEYIRKDSIEKQDRRGDFKIIRTYSAGVFAGYLKSYKNGEADLEDAIRIWKWEGAASLSQLAVDGVTKPEKCKFAKKVNVKVIGVIEIIDVTEKAKKNIEAVPKWEV